jgi:hypothetical protein
MKRRALKTYWEVFQLTLCCRVLLCSHRMKLNEHQARNVVDNNKRKNMICEVQEFRRP